MHTLRYGADDGWVSVLPDQPDGADGVHVRVRRQGRRLVITDLYLHGAEITPEILRGISVSRLQAALTFSLVMGKVLPADDLPADAVAPPIVRELDPVAGDDAPEPSLAELRNRVQRDDRSKTETPQRPPLTRPDGIAPEQFYPRVAAAYSEYAPHTRAPAKEIAAEAKVPVTTAHRWIREARRRGFLPPAKKGKVSE